MGHERRNHKSAAFYSDNLNQVVLDGLPYPIVLIRKDRVIIAANRIAKELGAVIGGYCWQTFGQSEFISDDHKRYINEHAAHIRPGGTQCTFCLADEALEQKKPTNVPDVEAFGKHWDTWWVPIGDDLVLHYAIDITDRNRMTEALRKKEKYYRSLLSHLHEDILVIDRDYTIRDINNSFLSLTGYNRDDVIGKPCYEISHGTHRPCTEYGEDCKLLEVFQSGQPASCLHEHIAENDTKVWADILLSPLKDENGGVIHVIEAIRDVSDLVTSQQALAESRRELFIRNRIAEVFLTVPDEEMYGEVLQVVLEALSSDHGLFGYINDDRTLICPSFTQRSKNRLRAVDPKIAFPREKWGGIWGKALVERKAFYSNGPFSVPEGHVSIARALAVPIIEKSEVIGLLLVANKASDYSGRDQALLESIAGYIAPVLQARLQRDRRGKEREQLQMQLRHSQKMEAIGTLAGGIAHDFNNILSAVLGFTELALADVEEGSRQHSYLKEVLAAGNRAKNLVSQILTFSRRTGVEQKPVEVRLIAREALKLLRASMPTTIEIRQEIKSKALVLGDPTQIHQVIMNLCTNADHAMRERGGVLEVTLQNVQLKEGKAQQLIVEPVEFKSRIEYLDLAPGPYLMLTVADTGQGIAPDIMESIFDPYFTTKSKGEGTGLGLSVVHGIVASLGGAITVESEPGRGTTFTVLLPMVERGGEAVYFEEKGIAGGSERILFIDDEPSLVKMGRLILESLGYEVETRTSSLEALELFKARPDRFDLVITDMTMPHMTGDVLAGKLMQIQPDIPVILCTGYSARMNEKKAWDMGIRAFIMKPFLKHKIAETVRKILDQ